MKMPSLSSIKMPSLSSMNNHIYNAKGIIKTLAAGGKSNKCGKKTKKNKTNKNHTYTQKSYQNNQKRIGVKQLRKTKCVKRYRRI